GLLTTTRDPNKGNKRLGLHVDSHERRPLASRSASRRLLSVNLAHEPRAFLFVALSIASIFDALGRPADDDPGRQPNATALGRRFLTSLPDCPVFRLELRPGEAYLAPVQNVIHDGSSETMTII